MNLSKNLKAKLFELASSLSVGDFAKISVNHWLGRTNVPDLQRVIFEYGQTLTLPPDNFLELSNIFEMDNGREALIDIPLWTEKETRSDLMISVLVTFPEEEISVTELRVP